LRLDHLESSTRRNGVPLPGVDLRPVDFPAGVISWIGAGGEDAFAASSSSDSESDEEDSDSDEDDSDSDEDDSDSDEEDSDSDEEDSDSDEEDSDSDEDDSDSTFAFLASTCSVSCSARPRLVLRAARISSSVEGLASCAGLP
jgi:hypothetical protein